MAINKSAPLRFTPRGLTDAYDSTDKFPGACRKLTNLVFDPSNPELVVSRPGVTLIVQFATAGFLTPGFISVQISVANRTYGMISTSRFAGKDEPFCFDHTAMAFVTITSVASGECPTSPATSGDWTPPTMAIIGTNVIITHPGYTGGGGAFFGVIDISNPAVPVFSATNTATNALPGVPTCVTNFNNRAYYAVGNQLWFSDELAATTITNADQFLVIGDSGVINCLSGLPTQTLGGGGILQTLTVFKQTQIWKVTGDYALDNLALDFISLNVGTTMPRSVVQSPAGLYFGSTGGPYFIDLAGVVRQVTNSGNDTQPDVVAPFQNAISPTRWAGWYVSTVYRACGQTTIGGVQQSGDYWFDERRRRWNGPHTFLYDCASAVNGYFVLTSAATPGMLIKSFPVQNASFAAADLGIGVPIVLQSSAMPKVGDQFVHQVDESSIELGASFGVLEYKVTAQNQSSVTLDECLIGVAPVGEPWGYFEWGDGTVYAANNVWGGGGLWGDGALWGSSALSVPRPYPVPWTKPFVFEKLQIQVETVAYGVATIGTNFNRYKQSGYQVRRRVTGNPS